MSVVGVVRAAHYCVVVSMAVLIAAVLLAGLAQPGPGQLGTLEGWKGPLLRISAITGYADKAGMGLSAMVYYAIVPLIVPFAAFSTFVYCMYESDGARKAWITQRRTAPQCVASAVLGILIFAAGLSILGAFKGQDARLLSLSGNFWSMALKGWVPFATAAALIGSGIVFVRRACN